MARNALRELPVVGAIALKSAKLVSLLKVVKFTKLLVTATSMLISVVAYGFAYGPIFAVALIAMLFIHEMGHVIALRRKGFPAPPPVFIPFLGAAIFAPDLGSREEEAYIGYGGPLLGSLAALLCMAAWYATGSSFLLLVAFLGIYLNLFNMIPIRPFDGGRITQILSPKVKFIGLLALVAYTIHLREPSLCVIWIFVLMEIRLPVWWRPTIATVIAVAMAVLFYEGYALTGADSHTPWWMEAIDTIIGLLFTALFAYHDYKRWLTLRVQRQIRQMYAEINMPYTPPLPRDLGDADERPYPPFTVKLRWTVIYLVSTTVLWLCMDYVIQRLPLH
jgi:Zn-dependent protease